MSRPNYLPCPMTSEIIRHIRQEQELYDSDPAAYERREREREEQREWERQQEREDWEER